ncbi:hypothetical protein KP509_26G033900 [Ceratopteris richardii]|uniref:Uncharacterized protein n=1 Tax=Ceratopteris richardii TaxID=49495 RepID=A0A8T2RKY1_CERRI|nr:hypothetical protein KP509_26G033900 [Ceratopteris richardii]
MDSLRRRGRRMVDLASAWAGASSTLLSAAVYLTDFFTTVLTLVTYYRYEYLCPQAPPDSALLRRDRICRAIRFYPSVHNFGNIFWLCCVWLAVAHISHAILFYCFSLRFYHRQILRVGYFLPLIQLYHLIYLLLYSFSIKRLREFNGKARARSSLYNVLGVAFETTPQVILQSFVVFNLERYVKGSSDLASQAQPIPKFLIVSIMASLASACYNSSASMYYLMGDHVPCLKRVCMSLLFGLETLVALIQQSVCAATIWQHSTNSMFTLPFSLLLVNQFLVAWVFACFIIQRHYQHDKRNIWANAARSVALAYMMRILGSTHMLVIMKKSTRYFICGLLVHAIGIMPCPIFMFLHPVGLSSPCVSSHLEGIKDQANKLLTCNRVKGILFPSYVIFILVNLVIIWHHKTDGTNSPPKSFKEILFGSPDTLSSEHSISLSPYDISSNRQIRRHQSLSYGSLKHFICLLTFFLVQWLSRRNSYDLNTSVV